MRQVSMMIEACCFCEIYVIFSGFMIKSSYQNIRLMREENRLTVPDREKRIEMAEVANKSPNKLESITELREIIGKLQTAKIKVDKIFQCDLSKKPDKAFKKSFEGLSMKSKDYHYAWIGLTKDNVAVVVGRSSYSKKARIAFGDLFKEYSVFGSVSQNIILKLALSQGKFKVLEDANDKLNSFITSAYIIPLDVDEIKESSELEREIGDALLKENKTILNMFSHELY